MIEIRKKKDCCGCTACKNICPQKCIKMKEDEEGFLYPMVDAESCINCGLCERVCPILHPYKPQKPLCIYAAKAKDEDIRMTSSSGGMFFVLAKKVIAEDGVVFGARFNDKWEVYHDYAETIFELQSFKQSKYVQSSIGNTYKSTEQFLKEGRKVLYTGTPCQIAGLKHYLRKEYTNLLTVDVICHGVPSPMIWRNYLEEVKMNACKSQSSVSYPLYPVIPDQFAKKEGQPTIDYISFRDKRTGWKKFSFALTLAKSTEDGMNNSIMLSSVHLDNSYMDGFLKNFYIRPSCYHCPSRIGKSHSDFTLADFWKLGKYFQDDDKGTSLLLINTKKGFDYFPLDEVDYQETNYFTLLDANPSFYNSHPMPYKRNTFWKKYAYLHLQEALVSVEPSILDYVPIKIIEWCSRIRRRKNLYLAKKI